jgi:glutamyl-tRNA reductase
LKQFRVIAITHKKASLEEVGQFHLEDSVANERLSELKKNARLEELMYLSTCNRVEFYFVSSQNIDDDFLIDFFFAFNPAWTETSLLAAIKTCEYYQGDEAVRHVFNVASSLDSMVVGEREIITQVRTSYDQSKERGLTGDLIRLVIKKTVEAAKDIYSHTDISIKPISVVSLAFKKLQEQNINENARILFVGAGQTNITMARFLKKNGYKNFVVFNRSVSNGLALAAELKCNSKELTDLTTYKDGFDVIITCTASSEYIINEDVYRSLLNGDQGQKVVIDLAIPNDFDPSLVSKFKVNLICVEDLRTVASQNLKEREKELVKCNELIDARLKEFREIYRIRQVELAMSEVPQKVKEIKELAMNSIFAKDLNEMDPQSRETLEKVLNYIEKKYISVPMKLAKDILLEKDNKSEDILDQHLHLN